MWWRMAASEELALSSPQCFAPLMAVTGVHVHLSVTVAGEDDSGEKDYRTYHSQFGNTGASGVMPADEDGDIKAGVLNDSASASAKLHSKALSKQLQADTFYAASLHASSLKANPSDQHRLSMAYGRRNIHNVAKISAIHDKLAASSAQPASIIAPSTPIGPPSHMPTVAIAQHPPPSFPIALSAPPS